MIHIFANLIPRTPTLYHTKTFFYWLKFYIITTICPVFFCFFLFFFFASVFGIKHKALNQSSYRFSHQRCLLKALALLRPAREPPEGPCTTRLALLEYGPQEGALDFKWLPEHFDAFSTIGLQNLV
jgi:hypothetical protein